MDNTANTQLVTIDNTSGYEKDYEGYMVILNTLAKFFSDTREDVRKYCDHISEEARKGDAEEFSRHFQTFMTFGDFDIISFKGVNRFARFFDLDQRSKYWLGKHQNLFLYRIYTGKNDARLYPYYKDENLSSGKKDFGFCYRKGDFYFSYSALSGSIVQSSRSDLIGSKRFLPFFLLTQISFSNEVITRVTDFSAFLKNVKTILREELNGKIRTEQFSRIFFDIYGCMNTSELAIVWLCSEYTEVLELIEYLKSMDFEAAGMSGPKNVFFSFYSVIGRTLERSVKAEELFRNRIGQCKGEASIKLAVSDSSSAGEVFDLCKDHDLGFDKMRIIPGEHDIAMQIPSSKAYDLLCEEDIESPGNGFFKSKENRKKILGIKISLFGNEWDDKRDNSRKTISLGNNVIELPNRVRQFANLETELLKKNDEEERKRSYKSGRLKPEELTFRELYQLIREELKIRYNSHTGTIDTLDMLYTDYLSNIHETFNALWRNDYHYQFKKSLIFLLEKVSELETTGDDKFWIIFTEMIENLRQQTEHFSQSGRLVIQIPASHLRYTASVDMLFHSYYGVAKVVLEEAYSHQTSQQYQSELLPIITTNITPMIRTKLYEAGKECDDLRILQIDIPYSLLFDPVTGFPFLIHELFHYITPSSRLKRNEAIVEMAVNEAFCYSWYKQIEKGIGSYLYDLISKENDLASQMGFVRSAEYDSPQSEAFTEDFHKYLAAEISSEGFIVSRQSVLKNSLAHVIWKNERIRNIRNDLVRQVTNPGIFNEQDKSLPDRQTLDETIYRFKEVVNRLPIDRKSVISDQIAADMREIEGLVNDKNLSEIIKRLLWNQFIRTDANPVKKENNKYTYFSDIIDKILYKHKYSLLNPNMLSPIKGDKIVLDNMEDNFLKGLKEAIPDYAMVRYCGMDDIEYLVTYARFTHDTYNSIVPDYDVLRLSLVLIWISDTKLYDGDISFSFEKFACENKSELFLEQYVAEYMPHLSQNDIKGDEGKNNTKEKILTLLSEALWWYLKLLDIVNKFKRDYDMYYDCILKMKEAYEIYFDNSEIEGNNQFKRLVDIVKAHRKLKRKIRKKLIPDSQWIIIHQIAKYCVDKAYPDNNLSVSRKLTLKEIRTLMSLSLRHPGAIETDYITLMNQYDRKSFRTILEFVQVCENQKTFESLGMNKVRQLVKDSAIDD